MRALKVGGVALLAIYAALCTLALYLLVYGKSRPRLHLPPFGLVHDFAAGSFLMIGTWRSDNEELAAPAQTTQLSCNRRDNECVESTVLFPEDRLVVQLPLKWMSVERWEPDLIVVRGSEGACFDIFYTIVPASKSILSATKRKANSGVQCASFSETTGRFGRAP